MRKLFLLLILALPLWQSCGLTQKAGATLDDYKAIAVKINKLGEKIEQFPAQVDAKVAAATEKAKAAGLNVEGTDAEFWKSVKDNPFKSVSAGIGTVAMAGFGVWQRNRAKKAADEEAARKKAEMQSKEDALAAVTDTVEELSPEAAKEFKVKVAAHPRMGAGAKVAVAMQQAR